MTESRFVNQNRKQWEKYDAMLRSWTSLSPLELGNAYLTICSDLSFAQTYFPDTQVCSYLNALALQFHYILYRRQPQRWKEFKRFFVHDVPLSFYNSRHYLLFALFLLILGAAIGVFSQIQDHDYFEHFFGHRYYETSIENIENGNPMGIYAMQEPWQMYIEIATNNILVGMTYFIKGLLSPFFTIWATMMTGIMMGDFVTFFFQHGYGIDALIAPNEHGSLELPAIIVCSAAGIQLGVGFFFPDKLSRLKALMQSAQSAATMVLAMIPVFAFAAFIESYITRHQELPMAIRLLIILCGLTFIIYYVIILPASIAKRDNNNSTSQQFSNSTIILPTLDELKAVELLNY